MGDTWAVLGKVPHFQPIDMADGNGATVIVGCHSPDCSDATIESSTDGAWRAADLGRDKSSFELHAVAFDGKRFVAVGSKGPAVEGGPTNAVAFASDDGRAWRRAPDQASLRGGDMVDIVARPGGGFEAVGFGIPGPPYTGFDVWSSEDGLSWRLVHKGVVRADGAALGLAVSPDGRYVAWGTDCFGACGVANLLMWASDDATTWRSVADQPAFKSASIAGMIAWPGGWLATGATGSGNVVGAGWQSADGRTWTRQNLAKAADFNMNGLVLVDGRAVALGIPDLEGGASAWDTTDGVTWAGPSKVPGDAVYLAFAGGAALTVASTPANPDVTTIMRLQ